MFYNIKMNVEKIITNDEFKIVFLKAIILGINYGEKEEAEKYKNSIENEIIITTEKLNNSKENNTEISNENKKIDTDMHQGLEQNVIQNEVFHKIQTEEVSKDFQYLSKPLPAEILINTSNNQAKNIENHISPNISHQQPYRDQVYNNNINNNQIPSNPAINHSIYLINKHETDIQNLENQKNSIFYLIESLSKTNYTFNYSKINLLKNSLSSINQEINRHHISILREKNNQKILIKNSRYQQFEQRDLYNKLKQMQPQQMQPRQMQPQQMQQQFFFRR
jgi:hypothetical protein